MPKTTPLIIDVPEMLFIMVDGKGDPNTSEEYKNALEILYGLSYSIKMLKMSKAKPEGYFDYVVPPLEGLWWGDNVDSDAMSISDKSKFYWTSMIRQPDFVTDEIFETAKSALIKKKPSVDFKNTRLVKFSEGLCAHVMHIGSYDTEGETIKSLEDFIILNGYKNDITDLRRHHEIYLGDPRKTKPENLKTVIRHPIISI